MIELILLTILILIGVLWFKNLTDNSGNEDDPEIAALRKRHANKWSTYLSIIVVSGFFVWLLITNGNF
jgi:amino acid transporter